MRKRNGAFKHFPASQVMHKVVFSLLSILVVLMFCDLFQKLGVLDGLSMFSRVSGLQNPSKQVRGSAKPHSAKALRVFMLCLA